MSNNKSLPAITATTFGEMFLIGSRRKRPLNYDLAKLFNTQKSDEGPEKPKLISTGQPHTDIEKGISPFLAWRKAHGWDFFDVARKLPLTTKRYSDIEQGRAIETEEEMDAFCRLFRLHPIEILNFKTNLITIEQISFALRAYNNPASYNFSYGDCHWDLHEDLDDWVEQNNSYDNLKKARNKLIVEDDPDNDALILFLNRLLVNDGNKAMGMNGVLTMMEHGADTLVKIAKDYERRVQIILQKTKAQADITNKMGKEMFGHRWPEYMQFTLGLLQQADEGKGTHEFAHKMFMRDIPARSENPTKNQKAAIFAQLVQINKYHAEGSDLDSKSALAARQAEKIIDFIDQEESWLTQYAVRQAILTQTSIGKFYGDPDDNLYLNPGVNGIVITTDSPVIAKMFSPK